MVEERRKARNTYGVMLFLFGIVLILILNTFLGTTIVSDKVDFEELEVHSLFCTFERVQFYAEEVISTATGEEVTRVNLTIGADLHRFYTYYATEEEFVDVGFLNWNGGQLLAFSSQRLDEGIDYVVDYGEIIYLYNYGVPAIENSKTHIIKINRIRQRDWFDEFALNSSRQISMLLGFTFVLTCSLFCLPFIEYHINRDIEKKIAKKRKRIPKKAVNV